MRYRRTVWAVLIGMLLVLALRGSTVTAGSPVKHVQLVYDLQVSAGQSYTEAFYPATESTLYVPANIPTIYVPGYTLVYYWALQTRYLPDWASLDRPVDATLIISQGSRTVMRQRQRLFTLWYPQGTANSDNTLFTDRGAERIYEHYVQLTAAYQASVTAYEHAEATFPARLQAMGQRIARLRKEGKPVGNITPPTEPQQPQPPAAYATPPTLGFVYSLPAGTYSITLLDGKGHTVPASQKTLVAYAPRRTGIGYSIIPDTKWTTPVNDDESLDTLYFSTANTLYLQPFREQELNDQAYSEAQDPQSHTGLPNQWRWVHTTALVPTLRLQVLRGSRVVDTVSYLPYYVQQTTSSSLGYTILPYRPAQFPNQPPSFSAYRVPAPSGTDLSVRLVTHGGAVVPGTYREVRTVSDVPPARLFGPALIPLAFFFALRLVWRRQPSSHELSQPHT